MRQQKRRGSAMILAIISFIILAGIGAAFFSISLSRSRTTHNASSRDGVLHIAEAGIDDMINRMSAWGMKAPGVELNTAYTVIKTDVGGKAVITGNVNGGSYTVEIYPAYTTKGTYRLVSTATKNSEKRSIETWVGPLDSGKFPAFGLFGDLLVDTDGGFFADSFKSTLGTYESQAVNKQMIGPTEYTYALTNGGLGSNGNIKTNNQSVVFGNVTPGPGGTYSGGAYVSGTKTASSTSFPMMPVTYSVPSGTPAMPAAVSGGRSDPDVLTMAGGSYHASEFVFKGPTKVVVTGEVTLYVDGQINMSSSDSFVLDGPNAKVKIIQGSGDVTFNGQALINGAEKKAGSFYLESSTKGTIKFNGGAQVYVGVYAPDATFTHRGTADFYGALVTDTVDVGGGAKFHYDEDINNSSEPTYEYKAKSWKEFIQ